ncbi:MAG: hypothetical protein ACFBZ8_08430 [Opitutales bacterium]
MAQPTALVDRATSQVDISELLQEDAEIKTITVGEISDRVPGFLQSETEDLGLQFLVQLRERRWHIDAAYDFQYYFTNNFFLVEPDTPLGEASTTVMTHTFDAGIDYGPFRVAGGELNWYSGVQYQRYLHGIGADEDFDDFDFDSQLLFTELEYRFWKRWVARAGVQYQRLVAFRDDFDEFYYDLGPYVRLRGTYRLGRSHVLVPSAGVHWRFTNVNSLGLQPINVNDRWESDLSLNYFYIWRQLTVGAFGRFEWSQYAQPPFADRDDYVGTAGGSINYSITNWLSARVYGLYEARESDEPTTTDYRRWDVGFALNASYRY